MDETFIVADREVRAGQVWRRKSDGFLFKFEKCWKEQDGVFARLWLVTENRSANPRWRVFGRGTVEGNVESRWELYKDYFTCPRCEEGQVLKGDYICEKCRYG